MSYFTKIYFVFVVSIVSIFYITDCSNITSGFMNLRKDSFKTKSGRLISFDASNGDLKIDLEFNIPFLEIPVQKSMNFAKNVVAKVNLPSLVLTGLMIFVSAVFLPAVILFVNKKFSLTEPFTNNNVPNSSSRNLNPEASPLWKYGAVLDNVLLEFNIDATSCMQRSICTLINNSKAGTLSGKASSVDKIIDGVTSNEWILNKIYNTPLYPAVDKGLNSVNCNQEYKSCRVSPKMINTVIKDVIKLIWT